MAGYGLVGPSNLFLYYLVAIFPDRLAHSWASSSSSSPLLLWSGAVTQQLNVFLQNQSSCLWLLDVCLCVCVWLFGSFFILFWWYAVSLRGFLITHNMIIQINVLISVDWTHWVLSWHVFYECFIRAVQLIATWLSVLYYYPRGKSYLFWQRSTWEQKHVCLVQSPTNVSSSWF